MAKWKAADIPSQVGRTALVTGANSGLGYFTSLDLARHGAQVIMTARDEDKGRSALARLKAEAPNANVELQLLDLADLDNVKAFAAKLINSGQKLDLLINNAGLMMPPRGTTKQGFETQFGVNHLGHFALTLLLLPLLEKSNDGRVVTVSSGLHRSGAINFDDLQSERSYSPTKAYSQSKIANVYFALELDRRLRAMGNRTKSLISHPGVAVTNLSSSLAPGLMKSIMSMVIPMMGQSAAAGALPSLYAATASGVQGGQFFGPEGRREMKGSPVQVQPAAIAKDAAIATRLWETSEKLTAVKMS